MCIFKIHDPTHPRGMRSRVSQRKPDDDNEDNTACIAQIKKRYIKGDRTKHISPKFFLTHDLQKNGLINIFKIRSSDNSTVLFTKSFPINIFE
jgi:hypothetical protein